MERRPTLLHASSLTCARNTPPAPAALTVLAFHGNGGNAGLSDVQLANLGGPMARAEVVHVPAPVHAEANGVVAEFAEPPFFSWWDDEEKVEEALRAAVASLRAKNVLATSEVNVAYGFSAGALVCALLSVPAVCKALGLEKPPWRAAVLACAAGGADAIKQCARQLGVDPDTMEATIPSFHALALDDPAKARGEQVAALFAAHDKGVTLMRNVVYVSGGHGVPRTLAKDTHFQASLSEWLRRVEQLTPPSRDAAASVVSMHKYMSKRYSSKRRPAVTTTLELLDTVERSESVEGPDGQLRVGAASVVYHESAARVRTPTSVRECLMQQARASTFVRGTHADDPGVSYQQLCAFIDGAGNAQRLGVQRHDDVVLFPSPHGPVGAILSLTFASQCVAAPFDPGASKEDWARAIEQIQPTVIVGLRGIDVPHLEAAVAESDREIRWILPRVDNSGFFDVELQNAEVHSQLAPHGDDTVLLLRTSGTTSSRSKLVPLRAGKFCANGAALAASLRLTPSDVALNAMPHHHIASLTAPLLGTACAGSRVLCAPKFEPSAFLDLVSSARPKVTWFTAVPTMHIALLHQAGSSPQKPPHSLRFVRSGAAALSPHDAAAIRAYWGVPVVTSFGMSEQMPITSSTPDEGDRSADDGTVGKPLCTIAIVDDMLRPVEIGGVGEVCVSNPCMVEYRDEPSANKISFFLMGPHRFFRTGDLGVLDEGGSLRLVGRAKELIKKGGEQVNPLEIEDVLKEHADVQNAIVFGVPSPTWGEEVGAAIILRDPSRSSSGEIIASLRQHSAARLVALKMPSHYRIVAFEDLPVTRTNKVKRTGLAEHLGIAHTEAKRPAEARTLPAARPSIGLNGLRYVAGVGVMFNHIGAVWQGGDERNSRTFGPQFHSARASTLYFPATVFFVLGGFQLSATLAARPISGSLGQFYRARLQTLVPLYLLAVFLALANLLIVCHPGTYSERFSWQPHPETTMGGDSRCQTSPIEMPYGLWLVTSALVFALGLQAWFPFWLLSGWVLYYAWFNSVYHFVILVFPWIHNALARRRGDVAALQAWVGAWSAITVASAGLMALSFALPAWEETRHASEATSWRHNVQNIYALSAMLFPPFWVPAVGLGSACYLWFDAKRPHQLPPDRVRWYGYACDVLTLAFVAFHAAMFFDLDWPYPTNVVGKMWESVPEEAHAWDVGLRRYIWSVLVTRLYTPLIAAWITLLAIPEASLTSRALSWPPLARTLAPTAYGVFLFHQIVGQWYWWATRAGASDALLRSVPGHGSGDWTWWEYPKEYYWFSPQPLPVAWYEFPQVVAATTLFSAWVNAVVLAPLTRLYSKAVGLALGRGGARDAALSAHDVVADTVEEMTGLKDVSDSMTLDELGLSSVGLPVLVGALSARDGALAHLSVPDVAAAGTLGSLVRLVADARAAFTHGAGI